MPDYEHTGSSIHPAIAERLNRLDADLRMVEGKCDQRHDKYNDTLAKMNKLCVAHTVRLNTIAGEDGRNGKLGEARKDVDDMGKWRHSISKAVADLQLAQAVSREKLGLLYGILGGIAALGGSYVIKRMGG